MHCPTPKKMVFASLDEGLDFVLSEFPEDKTIGPYVCYCEKIHVGHDPRSHRMRLRMLAERQT